MSEVFSHGIHHKMLSDYINGLCERFYLAEKGCYYNERNFCR